MKHFLLILSFSALSCIAIGQSGANQETILQKCIGLPELQKHYSSDPLYIMQHGVSFSFNQITLTNGRELLFLEKSSIKESGISEFFLFEKFRVNDNSAFIKGQYVRNFSGDVNDYVSFDVELKKEAFNWELVASKIKEEKQ